VSGKLLIVVQPELGNSLRIISARPGEPPGKKTP
jgi:hypothetical protein